MLAAGLVAFGVFWFNMGEPEGPVLNTSLDTSVEEPESAQQPISLEEQLRIDLRSAKTEAARIEVLDVYAVQPKARSDSRVLRSTMLVDDAPEVRLKAFQTARDLAVTEKRGAMIDVLSNGLESPHPEVQRESLRSCIEHPYYELQEELLEIAESGGAERFLAVRALAFLDDPVAQEKVLEVAMSEDVPRAERIQAIALLSRTDLEDGVIYLQDLAMGDDSELQRFAIESLSAWQDRQADKR